MDPLKKAAISPLGKFVISLAQGKQNYNPSCLQLFEKISNTLVPKWKIFQQYYSCFFLNDKIIVAFNLTPSRIDVLSIDGDVLSSIAAPSGSEFSMHGHAIISDNSFACATRDRIVCVYQLAGHSINLIESFVSRGSGQIWSILFCKEKGLLIIPSDNGEYLVWKLSTGFEEPYMKFKAQPAPHGMSWGDDQKTIWILGVGCIQSFQEVSSELKDENSFQIFGNMFPPWKKNRIALHELGCSCISTIKIGNIAFIASADMSGKLILWQLSFKQPNDQRSFASIHIPEMVRSLCFIPKEINQSAINKEGTFYKSIYLIIGTFSGSIFAWELIIRADSGLVYECMPKNNVLVPLTKLPDVVTHLSVNHSNSYFAASCADGNISIFDISQINEFINSSSIDAQLPVHLKFEAHSKVSTERYHEEYRNKVKS